MAAVELSAIRRTLAALRRKYARHRFVQQELDRGLRDLTMVQRKELVALVEAVEDVEARGLGGAFVECGCWRGGASFLMAQSSVALGSDRRIWMFDSFEGLPAPTEIDGPTARAWAKNPEGPTYYDNASASLEEVEAAAVRLGLVGQVHLVKGWFEETLEATAPAVGPIALLRIDADWYESVKTCLDVFYDQVVPGGIVILDDYYTWDGCTIAVHDFLTERRLPARLRTAAHTAYFTKPADES